MSPYYAYAPHKLVAIDLHYSVAKNSPYANPLVPYLPELIKRKALIYPVGDQAIASSAKPTVPKRLRPWPLNQNCATKAKSTP